MDSPIFSEGLIIAILSIFGYLTAYQYQQGFASYFSIPSELITIELSHVLFTIVGLLVTLYLIFIFTLAFTIVLQGASQSTINIVISCIGTLILLSLAYLVNTKKVWLLALGGILIIWLIILLPSFSLGRRLIEPFGYQQGKKFTPITDFIKPYLSVQEFFFLLLLLVLAFFTSLIGKQNAKTKVNFLVTNSQPEMAVIAFYGDSIICAPFNRKTKTISTRFSILQKNSENIPTFEIESIGPLKVEKIKQAQFPPSSSSDVDHP